MLGVMVDKRHILDEIKRTAEANKGKALGVDRFFQETGIKATDWHGKFWARWSDALREAGFQPNSFNNAYDEGGILEKFIVLIRELDRLSSTRRVKNEVSRRQKLSQSQRIRASWF